MLRDIAFCHVIFGSKKYVHPLKGLIHLCNGDRAVHYAFRDVDNGGGVDYVFFLLLAKMHHDFSIEIVVVFGIAAEDEEDFVGIVHVGRMRKGNRFGDGE